MAYPLNFWETEQTEIESHDWTFAHAPTRDLTHCYHDYPARMIPQVAGKLLDTYGREANLLFDPYCGSGTSLVEGVVRGIDVIGTDLNPLACLISKAKTSTPDLAGLKKQIAALDKFTASQKIASVPKHVIGISRLDFWFKTHVIEKLNILKSFIDALHDETIRLFFQVAFSETVRESSNTRNDEFKLYRYEAERLEKFDPDVFGVMTLKLKRNLIGLQQFIARLSCLERVPQTSIHDFDTKLNVPADAVTQASIDIVVTSPPYGDSHTTVAYGQYSRLSSAWLGLKSPEKVDRKLMGGSVLKSVPKFPSSELNGAIDSIRLKDEKRACEVAAFYSDLQSSISHVSQLIRRSGYACYVVGNRRVKGIMLPTDVAIRRFFEAQGFVHLNTFHRRIPNKRMPLRNSPTNIAGSVETTMANEHIIIMRRGR
jgi:site-specific DNA-methyltransferase (cytosine-N4-specific)